MLLIFIIEIEIYWVASHIYIYIYMCVCVHTYIYIYIQDLHKLAGAALIANLASGIRMHSRLVGNIIAPTWAEYGLTIWPQKNPSPARRTSMAPNMPEVAGESSAGLFAWGTSEVSVVQTFSGSPGHSRPQELGGE